MRYYLFAGNVFYPGGGWNDFVGAYDDLEAAKEASLKRDFGGAHVVDLETFRVVYEWARPY